MNISIIKRTSTFIGMGLLILLGIIVFITTQPLQARAATLTQLEGTWTMISESVTAPVGTVTSPAVNKLLTFASDSTFVEEYSTVTGYNMSAAGASSTCQAQGRFRSPFQTTVTGITLDANDSTVEVERKIVCTSAGSISSNALPQSLTFAPAGSWTLTFSADGTTMTATAPFGGTTNTQVYTKGNLRGGTNINANTNNSNGSTNSRGGGNASNTVEDATEQSIRERLENAARNQYTIQPYTAPIDYDFITEGVVDLTDAQRRVLESQLTVDVRENTTSSVTTATPVTVTRERGMRAQDDTAPEITLNGDIDLTFPNLPAELRSQPLYVIVTLLSDPVVRIARVDDNGQWSITVPANTLNAGEHTVYAAAEVNAVRGDQVQITKFVVEEKTRLSNTTWLVITNAVVLVLILAVILVVQLRRTKQTAL